ncbi:D-2-hydroxyacid dehydrogenase [Propionibacteriaceae bacterium Y1685]|uniref:D-2-hydroxyacid dehydrogenase n=1 Tax=Microlunatus sp. Y1700 TaxID=3418487 RepID=UPI003B8088A6
MDDLIVLAQPLVPEALSRVQQAAPGARVEVIDPFPPDASVPDALARATVLFADAVWSDAHRLVDLDWIQLGSHGYRQLAGLPMAGTCVTNASGVNDIPIAEWCVMMMLALHRDLPGMQRAQAEHRWDRSPVFQAELAGHRVGIFGYGNIGREVAQVCGALGLQVSVLSRRGTEPRGLRWSPRGEVPAPIPDRVFAPDQLHEFLSDLDFLVLAAPDTASTRGTFDAAALAHLPRHAFLLNPARAGLVDEEALRVALQTGALAGAALDDHYRQPMPADDPFFDLPNTMITAHISGSAQSPHFLSRNWDLFCENLRRRTSGEPLFNVIDPDDLDLGPRS